MLYIVATPIGNLEDITLRALRILREVDFIICEDTRVTAKLLAHYEIKKTLISYHHHSKLDKINYIIERLEKGENAALVSDAGTPGISDPGGILVNEILKRKNRSSGFIVPTQEECEVGMQNFKDMQNGCIASSLIPRDEDNGAANIKIISIPGACAAITLASVSGIAMDKFIFLGFPPHKKGRKTFFEKVCENDMPVIFYESCHRILKALLEISELSVNKNSVQIILGREMTKMFETIYRGNMDNVLRELESDKNNLKGEFTVIVHKTDLN